MAKRLKLIIVAVILCLSISVAFAGVASAKTDIASQQLTTHGPSINNVPSHVPADPFSGCRTWITNGKNWPAFELVILSFDGSAYNSVSADGSGKFSVSNTFCGFGPGKHRIGANGFFFLGAATDDVTFI